MGVRYLPDLPPTPYAVAERFSGDLTLSSTSFANVDTGVDLTLPAAIGDVIEYTPNFIVLLSSGSNVACYFDAATIVSGSPVNTFGPGTAGVAGWVCATSSNQYRQQCTGSAFYTVVSGDISSGNVLLRLRYKVDSSTSWTLHASSPWKLQVAAKNLRH